MLKTKIVCTLGPSTDNEEVLTKLLKNGMNVARINFSHGTYIEHQKRIDMFKKIRQKLNLNVALMLDTKGPEIRIGRFEKSTCDLVTGQSFTLTTKDIEGTDKMVSVTYKKLPLDLIVGNIILIDDGLIQIRVVKLTDTEVLCTVENGGTISNNKSINIPGVDIHLPYMSDKDKEDILFGIKNEFDFIAASFVRTHSDVTQLKDLLENNDAKYIQIISKIENQDGVTNIDEIIEISDGIMIARGDMGVEIAFEEIPVIQKRLIKKCVLAGKKVITATQMLDSMMRNPRPTRAETTDVANAVYDGTSAIMLSGETAAGKYPVESLCTMIKIAKRTEESINYKKRFDETNFALQKSITNAISHATCTTAHDLEASAIITVTSSGHTARMVSKFRPACPIIATTVSEVVCRQLALSWGIHPVMAEEKTTTDDLFEQAVEKALETGIVKDGDLTVITAGVPVGIRGTTNILKVHLAGHSHRKD